MAIRTCIFCDAVYAADDFDEDWDVDGCPECDRCREQEAKQDE